MVVFLLLPAPTPSANCRVEAYPDVTNVSFQIITLFPGHAAEEVERMVTIPIESVMNGIPKRVSMRSISLFGLSQITLVFEDDAQNDYVRNLANQLLGTVDLPPGAQPGLSPDATPIGEVYRYTLRAPAGLSRPRNCAPWKIGWWRRNSAPCRAWWTSIPLAA